MPTVFKRMMHLCKVHRRRPLSLEQKQLIGEIVRRNYFPAERESKEVKLPPHNLIQQQEPEGTFQVISYPRTYIPTIDKLLNSFYGTLPAPPQKAKPLHRARIGGKQPIASFKTKRQGYGKG